MIKGWPPLHINLSARFRAYVRPLGWILVAVCLALAVGIVTEIQQAASLELRIAEISPALARVRDQDRQLQAESGKAGFDVSDGAIKQLPVQVGFANQLVAKRTFSWTAFLSDLEEAVPSRVSIHSIRVEAKASLIRLAGSAKSLQDVTTFARLLDDHRSFANPALVQHHGQEDGHIEFDMTVTYTPTPKSG
ncbi:MAG: PilN domain-containing protein [Nitrospirae bacterium]|nr:PilN domain-containing protein [Nitrospirota bacterium]